jgi:hypothetical protein
LELGDIYYKRYIMFSAGGVYVMVAGILLGLAVIGGSVY